MRRRMTLQLSGYSRHDARVLIREIGQEYRKYPHDEKGDKRIGKIHKAERVRHCHYDWNLIEAWL